ncbi:hypothetical protein VTJ04DRAFT_5866 [Mycothermus thermophilus]|uniref:uncharacterized protein n=1 Tax=Humicola insolens TaxID=85995 RepID=UPI003743D21C
MKYHLNLALAHCDLRKSGRSSGNGVVPLAPQGNLSTPLGKMERPSQPPSVVYPALPRPKPDKLQSLTRGRNQVQCRKTPDFGAGSETGDGPFDAKIRGLTPARESRFEVRTAGVFCLPASDW